MSNSPLRSLSIRAFRGATEPFVLTFQERKKLTIVYGENASGKTTICDAFDLLSNGAVGSLDGRGLGRTDRYWGAVGRGQDQITITLESVDATCTARVRRGTVSVSPEGSRPSAKVLRRNQLLGLLEAQGAQRFDKIREFVDVAAIETSEGTLSRLIQDMIRQKEVIVARIAANDGTIEGFWNSAGRPANEKIAWAREEARFDTSIARAVSSDLTALRQSLEALYRYPSQIREAESNLLSVQDRATKASKVLQEVLTHAIDHADEIVGILEAAEPYLEKVEIPESCPLCESAERVKMLKTEVTRRLGEFSQLKMARENIRRTEREVETAHRVIEELGRGYLRARDTFVASQRKRIWESGIPMPKQSPPQALADLAAWLDDARECTSTWQRLEGEWQERDRFVSALRAAVQAYDASVAQLNTLDILLPRLSTALEMIVACRQEYVNEVLRSIEGEVGRLYEVVHPGEGLSRISLVLDPNRRASLDIAATFHAAVDSPPQAYFSQSHIDTLGLCVFLALAARADTGSQILVLDDIVASIDEPHVDRLIHMLYDECSRFRHCVITTHYRPWREKYRWGWLANGECQFVELKSWSYNEGLKTTRSISDVVRLRELLAEDPPDPQAVAGKAGVVLEAILDFLTQLYSCSVARRPEHRYTLGDLLPAIDRRLRGALQVEVVTGTDNSGEKTYTVRPLAPILDELTQIAQVRNVLGAHFSELSFHLLDSDSLRFGRLVLDLSEVLIDSQVGWPRNGRSGNYWATTGETRRLHPYAQPT